MAKSKISISNMVVNTASTLGMAVGSFQKAKEGILKRPEFIAGLSAASQWNGGSLQNTEQAQLRAARNSWFYTGVNLKALDLSASKFDIYNNPSGLEDEGEKAVGHPFLQVIRRPNPYMGKSLLMQYTEWWMDLQGEAFWFIEPDNAGGIKGIWPIPSNTMDIEFTEDGKNIKNYVIKLQRWYNVDPNYIVHFKYPNPWDFFRGLPPLIAFMLTIDADLAMKAWNGAFFGKDNVMPSAVISLGSGDPNNLFEQKDVEAVTEDLRNEYSAIRRKTVVTNANSMSVALLGYNSKDMDFLAGMQWNKEEILWAIGVPAGMVDKNSTEANAKVGNKIFKDNMWGIKGLMADEVTSQLLQRFYSDTLEMRFEDDRVYNRDMELKEAIIAKDAMTREAWAEKYFGVTLGPNDVTMSEGKANQQAELEKAKLSSGLEKEKIRGEKYPGNKNKPAAGTSNTIPNSNVASKSIEETSTIEDELNALRTKAKKYFKQGNITALKFHSDLIGDEMMSSILSDLHGVEMKSDIDVVMDHWQSFNKEGNIKGGAGSGENDGHPFRGNQWTDNSNITILANSDEVEKAYVSAGGELPPIEKGKTKGQIHGFYNPNTDEIFINGDLPKDPKGMTWADSTIDGSYQARLQHEIGHRVWHKNVSTSDKILMEREFSKNKYWHTVSWKASQGASEAFAELYSAKQMGYDYSSRLRKKGFKDFWGFLDVFERVTEGSMKHYSSGLQVELKALSWRPWSSFEPSLSSAIFSALQSILEFLIGKASEEIGTDTGIWAESLNILRDKAAPVIQDIASKAAKDIQIKLSTTSVSVSYDLMNVNAREWALNYAGSQIKNITDTTQKAVQKAIADWVTAGRDEGIEGLKKRIRNLKGEDGVPLFGERRADRIAQNEATSIYAGATERGLIDNGYPKCVYKPRAHVNCRCYIQPGRTPDGDKVIVWYTAKDEMVCTQELETPFGVIAGCRDLHKTIISEGRAGEKLETIKKSLSVKHYGPGPHENGSDQSVHGNGGGVPKKSDGKYLDELEDELGVPKEIWNIKDEDIKTLWRSMSEYEYYEIMSKGYIQSNGAMSFSTQKDQTFYASSPSRMYAEDNLRDPVVNMIKQSNPEFPSVTSNTKVYIIGVRNSDKFKVNKQREFYTSSPLSASEITHVVEGFQVGRNVDQSIDVKYRIIKKPNQ